MRALAAVLVVVASGCTLLLDVDSVRRNRDAGPPVEPVDAGPQFSQEPCGPLPPLYCVSYALDAGGLAFGTSAIAAVDGGFLVAVERKSPHQVELYRADLAGFGDALATWSLSLPSLRALNVAAAGDAWAVTWLQPPAATTEGTSVACVSGMSLASIPLTPAAVPTEAVMEVSSAVNAAGDVAISGTDHPSSGAGVLRSGIGTGGCPPALQFDAGSDSTYSSNVVSVPDGGFWLVETAFDYLGISSPVGGTFDIVGWWGPLANVLYTPVTVVTSDGRRLMTLVDYQDSNNAEFLILKPIRVDTASPGIDLNANSIFDEYAPPQIWALTACGPGCLASVVIPAPVNSVPPPVTVAFTDDTPANNPLKAKYYTASCGNPAVAVSLGAAFSQGVIGVSYSDPHQAKLFLCKVP